MSGDGGPYRFGGEGGFLTESSHNAENSLTETWDTSRAMGNGRMDKERRTRIEIAVGVAVVVILYLIDWLRA